MGVKLNKYIALIETVPCQFLFQNPGCRKLRHTLAMQNYALMHRESVRDLLYIIYIPHRLHIDYSSHKIYIFCGSS